MEMISNMYYLDNQVIPMVTRERRYSTVLTIHEPDRPNQEVCIGRRGSYRLCVRRCSASYEYSITYCAFM